MGTAAAAFPADKPAAVPVGTAAAAFPAESDKVAAAVPAGNVQAAGIVEAPGTAAPVLQSGTVVACALPSCIPH